MIPKDKHKKRRKRTFVDNAEFFPSQMSIDMFGGKAPCGHCIMLPTCLGYCSLCIDWKKKYLKRKLG